MSQDLPHTSDEPRASQPRRFQFHHSQGRWWFTIFGWGLRYKDSRRHLPTYDERINIVKNIRIGRHWFKILRP